jgi:hypothetical protein
VPLFEAPGVKAPPPVVSDQSPWPVVVLTVIVSVVGTAACVALCAVMVTGEAWQLTAVPASLIA